MDDDGPRRAVVPSDRARIDELERELADARQQLRARELIVDSLAEGVIITDAEGVIQFTNPALDRTFGYERATLVGQEVAVLGKSSRPDRRRITDGLRTQGAWHGELDNIRKDGTRFCGRAVIAGVELGGRPHWVSIHSEHTPQDGAQEALRTSEMRYRSVAMLSSEWIWEIDLEGNHTYCNRMLERLLGYSAEEFLGMDTAQMLHHDDRARARATLAKAVADKQGWRQLELRWRHKDGRFRLMQSCSEAMFSPLGVLVGFRGVDRDMTEQRIASERLGQSERLEALGRLAGGVAHDFNNMLTAILGNAELLLAKQPVGSREHALTTEINDASQRAADLVEELLLFSRDRRGEQVAVDMHALVGEVAAQVVGTLDPAVVVETSLGAEHSQVLGDRGQLQSALLNLVVHAGEATPAGGTVRLSTQVVDRSHADGGLRCGQYVSVRVEDEGKGMSREVARRVFDPFFTLRPGHGFGLAGVYGCAMAHGGRVTVASEVGHGSTFELLLPRIAAVDL